MYRLFLSLFLACALHAGELPVLKLSSKLMQEHNPLLPKLEPELWKKLLAAEERLKNKTEAAQKEFLELAAKLTALHKLEKKEDEFILGGIIWNRKNNTISIPAKLKSPNPGMPLEVLLCQKKGRVHETLFVSDTRPLHLEVLLHMADFKRGSLFEMTVEGSGGAKNIEEFLSWKGKGREAVLWKFTGSEFGKEYIPDNAGEHIIVWSRHEAVLSIANNDFSSLKVPLYTEDVKNFPEDSKVLLTMKIHEDLKKK